MAAARPDMNRAPGAELTMSDIGRMGGRKVLEGYGREFFEEIGRKGGLRCRDYYGSAFYEEIGAKGGRATAARRRERQP